MRGRRLISFYNFDRVSLPAMPGLSTTFQADTKEAMYRLLREAGSDRIDLCVYTRGGDINAVWSIVSIVREFDPDFEVLVPFRCHSSGTLLALGAKRMVLTPLAELSPIDPSTGNQFNPQDPEQSGRKLGISVEDVASYRAFVVNSLTLNETATDADEALDEQRVIQSELPEFLRKLVDVVHPLALGNVERVNQQIRRLGSTLLELHADAGEQVEEIVDALTTDFWSHVHMINRHEAKKILKSRVEHASAELSNALDVLLRHYEDTFDLRQILFLSGHLGDDLVKNEKFIGGVLESTDRSYIFETSATIRQSSVIPPNIQVQVPSGQPMPLVPGLPRDYQVDVTAQGWVRNKDEK